MKQNLWLIRQCPSLGNNQQDLVIPFSIVCRLTCLKHGIPDPSSLNASHSQSSNSGSEKENKDKANEVEEYMATPVFVHTKLQDQDLTPHTSEQLRKALGRYFSTSSFVRNKCGNTAIEPVNPSTQCSVTDSTVLSMNCPSFVRTVSERDWLKNSAKIWELVKSSPIISDYSRMLQSSGMFRR
ncbi:hypothetical protein Patl1_23843 [Pistacia atlantica]|uniref:Uncharacterized protein n=1 Tax=Pistacia atlantica TaxID=434234 RepID=A0ACC0ZXU6_9ROSI|nr:hypothetical protein Patl1_23843 [Pistacia atlantica]